MYQQDLRFPMTMITKERMKLAERLLCFSPNIRYNEVSLLCGYDDYIYFCKIFKKYYGVSPYKYRSDFNKQS